jgi:hypothetical protein
MGTSYKSRRTGRLRGVGVPPGAGKVSEWSQVELNRAMKGASFRRVNHAELKLPPWAKLRCLVRRIFWPKGGILVRLRSLWVTISVRKISNFSF